VTTIASTRLRVITPTASRRAETLAEVVLEGLSAPQKFLPSHFFYDLEGSHIFERICELPSYYLTRTEHAILSQHAPEIVATAGDNLTIVELGSGSSLKTRVLLEAALQRQSQLHYAAIDISSEFLRLAAEALIAEYPRLDVTAIAAEYTDGIAAAPLHEGPRLFLFLGSNIGNFTNEESEAFLRRIRGVMKPQDRLLLGIDLAKPANIIEAAYNDPEGVTELFNKNLLRRINHELGGRFNLDCFRHDAPFVPKQSRIEMRLYSRRDQTVAVAALDREFSFREGEYILTEYSHKYSPESFGAIANRSGLLPVRRWSDTCDWFSLVLLRPDEPDGDRDGSG
jgi:L-histidine Nalpha-methyltransferase